MGRVFLRELEGHTYKCSICDASVAFVSDLMSRSFLWHQGRSYLFNKVVNITFGSEEERTMLTTLHTVQDVFCCNCGQNLGLKYVAAHDKSKKYAEGRGIEFWKVPAVVFSAFWSLALAWWFK